MVEHGDLELKTRLLVESIRRIPALASCPIYAVQPRPGKALSQTTMDVFSACDVEYIYADLNRSWSHHGLMNKVYASAFIEARTEDTLDTLVLLDSDVILTSYPDELVLTCTQVVAVRPEVQLPREGIGQLIDQPLSPYWKMLYDVCQVSALPDWHVETLVDHKVILPYFNSGVVAVQPRAGIFRQWKENADRLSQNEQARAFAVQGQQFFFLEQALLAATLIARVSRDQIKVLSLRSNYPLPSHHGLPDALRASSLDAVSIAHYHRLFYGLYWMDSIRVSEPLALWLREKLPLRPTLQAKRSTVLHYIAYVLCRLPFRRQHRRLFDRFPRFATVVPGVPPS
jgi:hypothetical protein